MPGKSELLSPSAQLIDPDRDDHTQYPAEDKRSEQGDGLTMGEFGRPGEIRDNVSSGNPKQNGGNNGNSHGGNGFAAYAHNTAGDLRNGNGDITDCHDADHFCGQID